jgi:hypothetical protein
MSNLEYVYSDNEYTTLDAVGRPPGASTAPAAPAAPSAGGGIFDSGREGLGEGIKEGIKEVVRDGIKELGKLIGIGRTGGSSDEKPSSPARRRHPPGHRTPEAGVGRRSGRCGSRPGTGAT